MKSEDITAIATSIIALTLILGTVFYFQKEIEKNRFREQRIEKMQLKKQKSMRIMEEKEWNEKYKRSKDKEGLKKIYQQYQVDRKICKTFESDYAGFLECMIKKGYRENFIQSFNN